MALVSIAIADSSSLGATLDALSTRRDVVFYTLSGGVVGTAACPNGAVINIVSSTTTEADLLALRPNALRAVAVG